MTAPVIRRRHSESGPFLNDAGTDNPPVPIGEGSPGLVWRFQGNETPQEFTDVDPTSFMLFAGGATACFLTPNFEGPGWLDFELYLPFSAWGTSTVDCRLIVDMSGPGTSFTKRIWDTVNAGNQEGNGILFSDRMLYFGASGITRYLQSFQIQLTIEDDAAPNIVLDSPNAYAKLTQYVAPPTV